MLQSYHSKREKRKELKGVRSAAAADVYNMYTTPTSQQCSSDVRVFVAADGELSQLTGR